MMDIVFPENNEKEFIEMAEKLGYSELCFVYPKPKKIEPAAKIKLVSGIVCTTKIEKTDVVLLKSNNRNMVKKKPYAVFGIEGSKDSLHKKDSGLDSVVCREMSEFGVAYLISFSEILNSDDREGLLGRIMQNLVLCKKYKVKVMIASMAKSPFEMRNPKDLRALATVLGADMGSNF